MEDAVKKASDGSTDLSGAVLTYCDFFLRSEEVRTLKEKEELLHQDPELLALAGDKKKLEEKRGCSVTFGTLQRAFGENQFPPFRPGIRCGVSGGQGRKSSD